ncbi:MAG: cellulase family glycosylhydrolase [Pseudomonadota bacterium]|nr:cellulase family glycosylhydrolase [Pseudomonadota bacterium]
MLLLALLVALLPDAAAADLSVAPVLNRDLLAAPGNDAACLKSKAEPKLPNAIDLAVGAPADTVSLTWLVQGPPAADGPALRVTLTFADGVEMPTRLRWGQDILPVPVVLRQGVPVALGANAKGAPVVGTRWVIPTGRPGVVLTNVRVDAPDPSHTICITAAATDVPALADVAQHDTTGWYPFVPAWNLAGPLPQALPVTGLAGPVGKNGFVKQDANGHLSFEDGTRAKFWGINIVASPAFPPKEDAEAYARTLAQLGFNLVRLHHIDQDAPNGVLNPKRGQAGQPEIDPEQLDRLDYFISKLREQGLYLFLEVATARNFTAADHVPEWAPGVPSGHKLSTMFVPGWTERYDEWFETFWGRTNPYTKLRYADDPMVMTVELSNEHSLVANWGFGIENLPAAHLAHLDRRWNEWLRTRYPDDAALAAAWPGSPNPRLAKGESLVGGTVAREPLFTATFDKWPARRISDLYTFYAEVEETWYRHLETKARGLGFRAPIVPSISYDLPHIQVIRDAWRYSDAHFEWDYMHDNVTTGRSALATPEAFLGRLSTAIEGHTVAMSELGHPSPNPFRAEGAFLWAALASLQDWDMVVWFSWADSAFTKDLKALSHWAELRTAPVLLAQMPAASSAFRGGWIPAAPGSLPLHISEPVARLQTGSADVIRRPANYQPWGLLDAGTALRQRVRTSFAPTPPTVVPGTPAPGVGWWPDPGLLLLDQPMLQVRVGPPGEAGRYGDGIRALTGLEVALDDWAAVSFASTDGKPLANSKEAMLTIGTSQEMSHMLFSARDTIVASLGVGPVLVRPAVGVVRFPWPRKPVVTVLGEDGPPIGTVEARPARGSRKGWWEIETTGVKSPWMVVR